jgi:hypothetical protein
LPNFLSLSEALTGFESLDQNATLGQSYLDAISPTCTHNELNTILAIWAGIKGLEETERDSKVQSQIIDSDLLGPVASRIILLWYTGRLYRGDGSVQQFKDGYVEGLVWRAIRAHPIGYSNEAVDFYWKDRPEGVRYTGLDLH